MSRYGQRTRPSNAATSGQVSTWFGNQFADILTRAYGITATPVAWYRADDLSAATTGTVWPNAAELNPGAITAPMTATQNGTLTASWRNGRKALSGFEFKANITGQAGLTQGGNFTMITVTQTDGSGFGPFFGIGEWWGNYSQAYGGYYFHGYYGGWGNFTASPAVVGMTHVSGATGLRVFSNSSYASDAPGSAPDAVPYIATNSGATSDYIAEILIYNTVLSDNDINAVTVALRSKYGF